MNKNSINFFAQACFNAPGMFMTSKLGIEETLPKSTTSKKPTLSMTDNRLDGVKIQSRGEYQVFLQDDCVIGSFCNSLTTDQLLEWYKHSDQRIYPMDYAAYILRQKGGSNV